MPLEVTKPMLQCISTHYGIGSSMWDLPSCFYRRNMDVEEAFCIPYTQSKGLTNTGKFEYPRAGASACLLY